MTPERWRRIEAILEKALEQDAAGRVAFLDQACGDDRELRSEVESLLVFDANAGQVIAGVVGSAATQFDAERARKAEGGRIGVYRILREVGRGGMGTVYLGERADEFRKKVAIKVVTRGMDTGNLLERFRYERQILARLEHPYIARLLDGGSTKDGRPYLVMEYVEGKPITRYCSDQGMGVRERIELFRKVCEAVQCAHQNLVVHRDLKPDNILIGQDGSPKLLDFGIAKLMDPGETAHLTLQAGGLQMLTPDYASPEQICGEVITVASDIYSLGAVLYQLLTSAKPHRIEKLTPVEIERAICTVDVIRPSLAVKDRFESRRLSGDLDNILMRALDKEPARRYASVERFSEDLRRYLEYEPVDARPNTLVYRARKFVRRERAGVLAVAAVIASLAAGMVIAVREMRFARQSLFQVRSLANTFVFDVHDAVRDLPGSTRARRLIVETGLRYLDQLSRQSRGDPELRAELAAAYQRIGDVQGDVMSANLGDTKAALASYGKAMALVQSLLAEDPANPKAQLEQMRLLKKIAGIYSYSEDSAHALDNYRQAEQVGEQWLARDAANQEVRRQLASIQMAEAEVLRLRRENQAAWQENSKALQLLMEASAVNPTDRALKLALAEAYAAAGASEVRLGRLQEGLARYREAEARIEQLHRQDPANVAHQRSLMQVYSRIGDVLGNPNLPNLGDTPGAVEAYTRMLDMARRLYEADPADQRALSDYAIAMTRVAAVTPARRIELLKDSARMLEQVERINPQNAINEWDLAHGLGLLGDALMEVGDRAGALHSYREGLDKTEKLLAAGMDSPAPTLIAMCQKLAADATRQKDRATAMTYAQRALEVSDPQGPFGKTRTPTSQRMLTPLGPQTMGFTLAALAKTPDERREAAGWLTKSLAAWREAQSDAGFGPPQMAEMRRVEQALAAVKDKAE